MDAQQPRGCCRPCCTEGQGTRWGGRLKREGFCAWGIAGSAVGGLRLHRLGDEAVPRLAWAGLIRASICPAGAVHSIRFVRYWRAPISENDIISLAAGVLERSSKRRSGEQKRQVIAGAIIVGTIPVCGNGDFAPGQRYSRAKWRSASQSVCDWHRFHRYGACFYYLQKENWQNIPAPFDSIGVKDTNLIMGFWTSFGLDSGCSRSGSTLTVAMLSNLKREDAARLSFSSRYSGDGFERSI